jgi:alkylmercury lyase
MVQMLAGPGGPLDYGPERSRLLARVQRALASGRALPTDEAGRFAADLGIAPDEADAFLRTVTERDAADNIVGALGLSLNEHPHRFVLNGTRLSTWCAEDALFLPAVLDQTAFVESLSPVSGQPVRLQMSPRGVEAVSPDGAVVSIVVAPEAADLGSVEAIWTTFCHHIFYFVSREEAEQWAAGRGDIEILSVPEAYELGRQLASRFLA